ncbi:MAG: 2-dehydro-3-deoxy-D-gluconate 5-dehydrogenase KduD [Opitutaceae bacterium]|jgi:2-deoxy-D-gluconate 3-dehydrogenase|nr:2-dehydro-3-deoxy-D-gluconate 5-dehydrogenase KduD [Opitutaceae bacterium]
MSNILDSFKLNGKKALVTGAGRGLGQGYCKALAEAGADIVAVDIGDMTETKAYVEKLGRKCHVITANLMDRACYAGLFDEIKKVCGGADILVNNAGMIRREDFTNFSAKDWDDVINLNLSAVFFLSQLFARECIARGAKGKIINIASMLSFQGGIRVPSYAASKGGIKSLTMLMANELAAKGICTNAIAPGYFATDNTAPIRADASREKAIVDRIPAGRWGTPDDLMGVVVFLASPASDYVNGYTVAVDGGWLAR